LPDWQSIVQEHGPAAFNVAWRLLGHAADTEDAVQEALRDAFVLHGREPVTNWGGLLRHMVTRRAIDRLRRRRPSESISYEPAAPPADQPDAIAIESELAERLRRAIAELPDREGSVFALKYFGEMSADEIGVALGISSHAASEALHKARTRLKRLLNVEQVE